MPTNRRETERRKTDQDGGRGPRGERGPAGPQGPPGPPGPENHRYDALVETVEHIADELKVQFRRFAQIQQQLDDVARELKDLQRQQSVNERPQRANRRAVRGALS